MSAQKNTERLNIKDESKPLNLNRVIRLHDLNQQFTNHFDHLGGGHLRITTPGVEIAIQQSTLSPTLYEGEDLSWPEAGVTISMESLENIYTRQLPSGMILLECDFEKTQAGLSFLFQPESKLPLFELIMELNEAESLSLLTFEKRRSDSRKITETCACCIDRARRIKNRLREHPLCQILESIQLQGGGVEININNEHVRILSLWKIDQIEYDEGRILLSGRNDILSIDVSQIFGMQIHQESQRGVMRSIFSCHHSCKGEMIVLSVIGESDSTDWVKICEANQSIYIPVGSEV